MVQLDRPKPFNPLERLYKEHVCSLKGTQVLKISKEPLSEYYTNSWQSRILRTLHKYRIVALGGHINRDHMHLSWVSQLQVYFGYSMSCRNLMVSEFSLSFPCS